MLGVEEHRPLSLAAIDGMETISLCAKSRQTRASAGKESSDVCILKVQDIPMA